MNKLTGAKFLYESGLLFEINRKVLHPLGLELEVIVYDGDDEEGHKKGDVKIGDVWDYRDNGEGMAYDDSTLGEGTTKLLKYLANGGFDILKSRQEKFGSIYQGIDLYSLIEKFSSVSEYTSDYSRHNISFLRKTSAAENDKETPKQITKVIKPILSIEEKNRQLKEKYAEEEYDEDMDGRMIKKKKFNLKDLEIVQLTKSSCTHPPENIEQEILKGGGSTIFCTLCGTTFKMKEETI